MIIKIFGSTTLDHFTREISKEFSKSIRVVDSDFFDLALVQIHGSINSKKNDLQILDQTKFIDKKIFLIHRPDEILAYPEILSYFEEHQNSIIVFLGDLVYRYLFWSERKQFTIIIPHPFLDLTMPTKNNSKWIVGAYTSWGEMRNLEHYLSFVEHLKSVERPKSNEFESNEFESNEFEFRIGGPGLKKELLPTYIHYSDEFFVPHFNVQLYHFNGKKRYCESSGSLHRGITIPVIFEANGAERLENLQVIKIDADDELKMIDYDGAVQKILSFDGKSIQDALNKNHLAAKKNQVSHFFKSILEVAQSRFR